MSQAFGISPLLSVVIIGVTCIVTIWGGLRRISDVMSRAVPIMAVLYILMGLGVLILNAQHIPAVAALIFRSAFSPTAAAGGFAGATVRDAIQYGVARGIYSNDAGTGYGMIAHASAQTDHPVRQSLWGWGEVFIDTFIICSITAFTIIITGSYTTSDATSGALTTVAFTNAYGAVGGKLTAIAIAVFAWTTIIGMHYTCEKSVNYAFGDTEKNAAPESGIIGKNDLRRIRQALPGAGGSHAAKTICTRNIYKTVPPRILSRELRFHTCRPTTQTLASSSGRNEAGPAKVMSFRQ